jgi:hypothetical protein
MPQKSKARTGPKKASKAGTRTSEARVEKTQSERFIEAARALGVDESGKDFEAAIKKITPPKRKRTSGASS